MPKLLCHGENNGDGSIDWDDALRHVTLIAMKIRRSLPVPVDLEDLVAEGLLGLVEAARGFDPQRKLKFRTYSEHRIRGAILDSLRRLDPLSRDLRRRQRAAERAVQELAGELGRIPAEDEIAARLSLSLTGWRRLAQTFHRAGCPVNGHHAGSKPATPATDLPAPTGDPEACAARNELRHLLSQAIASLPFLYQEIIELRYGHDWTLPQIGRALGIHESRVSQMHGAAIRRMRVQLESLLRTPVPTAVYNERRYTTNDGNHSCPVSQRGDRTLGRDGAPGEYRDHHDDHGGKA